MKKFFEGEVIIKIIDKKASSLFKEVGTEKMERSRMICEANSFIMEKEKLQGWFGVVVGELQLLQAKVKMTELDYFCKEII